ncbi:uncharacterized protein LOC128254061 isoform X2 [Drosophila gunungcola]|uniref:Uncharacterized protein n=1 Tax=Drosophila gunungcola TaxID=103775 RepID=A0A9Q0BQ42_9MUSC|nr:uncharacterized protein LOC128254061 isoform X2 [Drosophila gunungcola]KAI8039664.1 hypothetical protein M5D96_007084 [Drosophila gunungcola]
MSANEFSYRRLLPTCRVVVSIMACLSILSGVIAGYLFMTSMSGVSLAVRVVWTTGSAIYALASVLLIIGVWKLIRWLVYPYMCLLLMAIAVYTMILQWLFHNLPAAVFASVAISFIFLGVALHLTKSL